MEEAQRTLKNVQRDLTEREEELLAQVVSRSIGIFMSIENEFSSFTNWKSTANVRNVIVRC